MSMADESMKLWEDLFDEYNEAAGETFIVTLLRDARAAERARQGQTRKEEDEEQELEEQRHARVFEPWQPPLPPPVAAAPRRVKRTVVTGLRVPPHLLPPGKHERTESAPAADHGRSAKPRVA